MTGNPFCLDSTGPGTLAAGMQTKAMFGWESPLAKHDKDINISFRPDTLVGRVPSKSIHVLQQNTVTLLQLGRGISEVPWWQYCELR